jgi:hypothetical protein
VFRLAQSGSRPPEFHFCTAYGAACNFSLSPFLIFKYDITPTRASSFGGYHLATKLDWDDLAFLVVFFFR